MAFNVQSDEYSLITNNNQNKTKSGPWTWKSNLSWKYD
jgi:hypothetical protein